MYIERTLNDRAGRSLGEPLRERVPSESRDDARKLIERQQSEYPFRGYNDEQDYWWARHDADEYQITRWWIRSGSFE